MKSIVRMAVALLACFALCGCMDSTTTVTVNPDGTGTIVETTYMSAAATQMMEGMAAGAGGKVQKPAIDPAQFKARAATMGEGVTFVGSKELKKDDGSTGTEVQFAFTDINKLKVTSNPTPPGGASPMAPPPAPKADAQALTFQLTKGATPVLVINLPKPKPDASRQPTAAEKTPSPEEMQMMKQMFDGFRFRLQVKVNGVIGKSNAAFVEADPASGKKQVVTLMDMDLGKAFKDDASMQKLMALGKIQDMETARTRIKDIPGIRFEPAERVEVSFK